MELNKPVRPIAIVGIGVIGASWAAEFLAHGFDVAAADPAPNAEQNLRKYIDAAWPARTAKGLEKNASRERLAFSLDLKATVSHADSAQENGPERPDFKIKLAVIDAATPTSSIIASSSSGITMSVTQSACAHLERCVIGRPFTPSHMVPLVERKEVRACLQASHVS
jgi:3-hydroxyacyl-CoA dehydrogenase